MPSRAGGRNVGRLNTELRLLQAAYGPDNVFWPRGLSWVMVRCFPLPKGYNRAETNIVVLIPDGYGYGPAPKHCFVDRGLKLWHRGRWRPLPHYFLEEEVAPDAQRFYRRNWAYLCVHPLRWKPGLHTLLTYLTQVGLFLSDPLRWDRA